MNEENGREIVNRIKANWQKAGDADARACFERFPEIAHNKSWAVDLAYEEFCLKEAAGHDINIHQFCGRFPAIRHSLTRALEVHQFVQDCPDCLEREIQWPELGETFHGFLILDHLGSGSLARVYLCSQPDLGDRQVVVKFAIQGGHEAQTLGRLTHPNIVPIYSAEEDEESGVSQICMPFCGRSTLCDVMDGAFANGNIPERANVILTAANARCQPDDRYDRLERPDRRFRLASYIDGILIVIEQLADALSHAHQHGILHGDIKPSNVLIAPNGKPMLLDFNLAHDRQRPAAMTGGTLPYMAPEQIRAAVLRDEMDAVEVDERADIYSLAVILHELLCGRLPFGPVAEPIASPEIARQRLESQSGPITPLSGLNPSVDTGLDQLIQRCLAYDPADRPQAMKELSAELSRQLRHALRTVRWMHVNRRAVLVTTGTLALGAAGLVVAKIAGPERHYRDYQRGLSCYDNGDFEDAIKYLSRAVDVEPKNVRYRIARGRVYIELVDANRDNWRKAADDFLIGRDIGHGRSTAYFGYCMQRLGMGSLAIVEYRNAIRLLDEPTVGILNNLGFELTHNQLNGGRMDGALSHLFAAHHMDPGSMVVVGNILSAIQRRVMADRNDGPVTLTSDELQVINNAFENCPANAEVYFDLATILVATLDRDEKNLDRLLQCFERAAQLGLPRESVTKLQPILPKSVQEHSRYTTLIAHWPDVPFGQPPERLLDPFAEHSRSKTNSTSP